MTDPTPKLLLAAFGLTAIVVAGAAGLRFQAAKRFWHAREVLTVALAEPDRAAHGRDELVVECRDCRWAELLAGLPPVDTLQCFDDAVAGDERGVRCRVFFDGSRCFDADVFGGAGAWRVWTTGRVYRPCLP